MQEPSKQKCKYLLSCITVKMSWRPPSLHPPQILNDTGDMEPLGKQHRFHCRTYYGRGLEHSWEMDIPARSKRSFNAIFGEMSASQEISTFFSAAGLQSQCKFSYLGNFYFLQLFKLLCFLRWIRMAILVSKDKCKSLESYYCADFTDLENFRSFGGDCVWSLEGLIDILMKSKEFSSK